MRIPNKINDIIEELKDQYMEKDRYNRPWIIGFSGGKDSTVLLILVLLRITDIACLGKFMLFVMIQWLKILLLRNM